MAKILFISDDNDKIKHVSELFGNNALDYQIIGEEEKILENVKNFYPDLILLDESFSCADITVLAKKIKLNTQSDNIIFTLLVKSDCANQELLKTAISYVSTPINNKIFISTLMSNIRMKTSLDILSQNNADLAKSLYQLDVLYNTSTQFAGSLDEAKLIDIMLEGLEKSLSFSFSYTFLFSSENDIKIIINSLHPISERFEQALKVRAILSYKTLFDEKLMPYDINIENVKIDKRIKHSFDEYDLPALNFDNMFAPITVGEKIFGIVEVFKENEFKSEDATCFQTLTKQVSIPLETAVLYNEIKETNLKLERLEQIKSEFISIVSHELRTPLTAIKTCIDILQSGSAGTTTPVMDNFLTKAQRNARRLKGIINDLLDLSKIEAGKMEYRFEKTNIKIPIENIKNMLENMMKEKNIVFNINHEKEEFPLVYLDPSRIEQVLSNLLSNAIKFTPENGEISVLVNMVNASELPDKNLPPEKNYIKVSVKDSGIGIEKESLEKVFDKFQQIENSLSRKVGGTGLGLPIAKQLIDAHHGKIWAESNVNQGSVFSFVIPILNDAQILKQVLENQVNIANTNNYPFAIIKISEKKNCEKSFIDNILKEETVIVRKTSNTKEFMTQTTEKRNLYITAMQIDKYALNFIEKKIEGFLQGSGNLYEKCDIVYLTALLKEDVNTFDDIIEKFSIDKES